MRAHAARFGREGFRRPDDVLVELRLARRSARRLPLQQRAVRVAVLPEVGMKAALVSRHLHARVRHEERGAHAMLIEQRAEIVEHRRRCPLHIDR